MTHHEQEMLHSNLERKTLDDDGSNFFAVGLLIGAAVGAAAALVFAPKPGEQIRSQLVEKGIELKGRVAEKAPATGAMTEKVKDLVGATSKQSGSTTEATSDVQRAVEGINQATHSDIHPHEHTPGSRP